VSVPEEYVAQTNPFIPETSRYVPREPVATQSSNESHSTRNQLQRKGVDVYQKPRKVAVLSQHSDRVPSSPSSKDPSSQSHGPRHDRDTAVMNNQELETYQLAQVELALQADPDNEELISLRSELKQLIQFTAPTEAFPLSSYYDFFEQGWIADS